jgi:hypothetical protein
MRLTSRTRRSIMPLVMIASAAASGLLFGKEIVTVRPSEEGAGVGEKVVTVTFDEFRAPPKEIKKSISVAKGDILKVRLPSQALGYLWRMSSAPLDNLKRIVPKKDQQRPEKDRSLPDSDAEREKDEPGGREYRIFRFQVEGEGTLEFRHIHSGTKKHAKVCEIQVKVADRSTVSLQKGDSQQ